MGFTGELLGEDICPVCGKKFYAYCGKKNWVYREGRDPKGKCVCSWACARASEVVEVIDFDEEEKEHQAMVDRKIAKIRRNRTPVSDRHLRLSEMLLNYMSDIGITQQELSDESGISISVINLYLHGKAYPSRRSLKLLIDNEIIVEEDL